METETRRLSDSTITTTCDGFGARAVFAKMAEAVMPSVPPEKTKIVRVAEGRATAFAAGKHSGAVGAAVSEFAVDARTEDTRPAESAVVRCADRRAAEFAAGKSARQ